MPPAEASYRGSGGARGLTVGAREVSRVLDARMLDLERRVEQQIGRAAAAAAAAVVAGTSGVTAASEHTGLSSNNAPAGTAAAAGVSDGAAAGTLRSSSRGLNLDLTAEQVAALGLARVEAVERLVAELRVELQVRLAGWYVSWLVQPVGSSRSLSIIRIKGEACVGICS